MTLVDKIKYFFSGKQPETKAPEGMCPTCWGYNEWDNEHYKIVRDKHFHPESDIYNSFISKIVDKHVDNTHKHENKYICTTCEKEIPQEKQAG